MGRHGRATPHASDPSVHATAGTHGAPEAHDGGRHRGSHRKRRAAPVRTGLLGISAAVAMGAVGVSSGLIPGPGGYTLADSRDPSDKVRADGVSPSDLATQGGPSSAPSEEHGTGGPGRNDGREARPSSAPSEEAETKDPAAPSSKPKPESTPAPTRDESSSEDAEGGAEKNEDDPPPPAEETAKPLGDTDSGDPGGEAAAEAAVLTLVNQERARAGCEPVTADPTLAGFAADFSEDMAARGFFSHTTPDGKSPWDRAKAAGISDLGGENIARGQANAQSVMDSWMNSPGHRANILNCDYRTMGVGAHFAPGGPWWTQNFGF
ncbi:CAP domain-containing protein [Streptomyces sp. N2-109]|uniref:CAP domain-containing protein n=1 Tax=Streptomyces gossypii TaxID=2883101 RepID=A0ABT2K298_9ACTN|nr:CAP domain-containing protein [Streptomyces gossypii]MCT2594292.1 CAP domain-containing protein [Streptomyces gossypii]